MLARVEADPEQRIVLAELEGEVVGAAYLTRIPTSPFALDSAVHMSHLQVVQHARRHGAGKALVESAVLWAEEKGACTVMAAATAHDREANRYLARLGFASLVVTRAASVSALRAGMLPVEPPACARSDVRNARTVGQVLAQRRSLRRAKTQAL
jgi:N-acetylglutamate synthase-like GNAT family acetyltransferase